MSNESPDADAGSHYCRKCEHPHGYYAHVAAAQTAALSAHLAERDAARDRETAARVLREAADDMLNGAADPDLWNHAAFFLRHRADRAASEGGGR